MASSNGEPNDGDQGESNVEAYTWGLQSSEDHREVGAVHSTKDEDTAVKTKDLRRRRGKVLIVERDCGEKDGRAGPT